MKESSLYTQQGQNTVQCQNCAHYCAIPDHARGICGVKKNQKGKLYSLNYGKVIALNVDPIEKKPMYQFLPNTLSLSLGVVGCNFKCASCQNWEISQMPNLFDKIEGKEATPQEVVNLALEKSCPSISYTYTEPTIFSEFALETMKLAHQHNLKNVWVSNGFWSPELFELISPYLDAVNIDLKSSQEEFYTKYCQARLQPVLDNIKRLKDTGIWVEITTLVIPGLNDSEQVFTELAQFIKTHVGPETPWHLSKFSGEISWKLQDFPTTPKQTLYQAKHIGENMGLKNIYLGNI